MSQNKRVLLILVSAVTIGSLITTCCCCGLLGLQEGDEDSATPTRPRAEGSPTQVPRAAVEVVSERELTTEEFFQRVEGNQSFADVYELAREQGYSEPGFAGEGLFSDGSTAAALALSSPDGESVLAIHGMSGDGSHSILLTIEGDALVLYDREFRAELTEQGIAVFDAEGNPIGGTQFPQSSGPSALGSTRRQGWRGPCLTGYGDELWRCLDGVLMAGGAAAGCAASVHFALAGCAATVGTAPCWPLVLASLGACAVGVDCMIEARDNPPTIELLQCRAVGEPQRRCETCSIGPCVVQGPTYECPVRPHDDRERAPADETFTLRCGEKTLAEVLDCGGNHAHREVSAPRCEVERYCERTETCVNGECQAVGTPLPQPTPVPPTPAGPTGPPEIRVWLHGEEMDDAILILTPGDCFEFRWEAENADTVKLNGEPLRDTKGEKDVCLEMTEPENVWEYTITAEGPVGPPASKHGEVEVWWGEDVPNTR